jgi:hypothetical protein
MSEVKSLGERRVRVSFNPSNSGYVDQIKQKIAEVIDMVNDAQPDPKIDEATTKEFLRLKALSLTALEEAAMWAVKAATI